jgi:hypothetical protein
MQVRNGRIAVMTGVVVLSVLSAPGTGAAASGAVQSGDKFICMAPKAMCLDAARRARSAPEAVQLVDRAVVAQRVARATAVASSDAPSGYGFTTSPGAGDGRYYGWQLSRSALGRDLEYDTCVIGPGGTCQYAGTVAVQANFNFNGSQVRNISASIWLKDATEPATPQVDLSCDEKGFGQGGCGEEWRAISHPVPVGTTATFTFSNIFLQDGNDYDIALLWSMTVPTYSPATSGWYDSLDFKKDDSGVYYPGFGEGDST